MRLPQPWVVHDFANSTRDRTRTHVVDVLGAALGTMCLKLLRPVLFPREHCEFKPTLGGLALKDVDKRRRFGERGHVQLYLGVQL